MSKEINESDFSRGSILGHMVRLAIPMTLAQLVNVLYNIIDRIFIGRIPVHATNALGGLGVAFPICTITIAFANLIGMGGAPLFSMSRGAGEEEKALDYLGNSFVLLIGFGVTISVLFQVIKKPFLYLLGASDVTYPYALSYITVYLLGTVFVMLSLGMNAFINAQGFGKIGMATVSIGAVVNIILDPVFIFVFGLGVQGAAVATVIAQFCSAMWTLYFLTGHTVNGKKAILLIQKKHMSVTFERAREICTLGMAGFVVSITNSLVQMSNNACLSMHGGDLYVAAMTVINSVREIVHLPIAGLAGGGQPVLSFNYGAKEMDRTKQAIRYLAGALLIYTTLAWVGTLLLAKPLVLLFNQDPELLPVAIKSMKIYFFGFFFMAFQFAGQTTFQAMGKSKRAIFFSIFRKVIIVIPLVYLLPNIPALGVNGVFWAEPISNLIGGVACFTTMYITVYRRL